MIGIIMLNYNEWDMSIECIKSIRDTIAVPYRIYLVDNCSSKPYGSDFDLFLKNSNDISLINSSHNLGYAGGNNIGIKQAMDEGCELYLITNNDVVFSPGCIENLSNYLKENKKVGIVGPKVHLPDGSIQEINMGCKTTLLGKYIYILRKTPLKFISRNYVRIFHCEDQNLDFPFKVYAVSGCCFMVKKPVMEGLYPLDEGTFLYEEENIIGCRMEQLGFETVYCTDAEIVHLGGGSTKNLSEFSYKCGVNSEVYYCKKYLGANIVQIIPLYLIRMIVFIKTYGIKKLNTYIKETSKNF